MSIAPGTKAHAFPTKEFFVSMITRDIDLDDCLLDLIDNSVDSAWNRMGGRPMGLAVDVDLSAFRIEIEATADRFSIRDNCGGMTLDDAVNHAFSFGRTAKAGHDEFSIGVYGIGMKRAIFKLGSRIRVRSTVSDDEGRLAFEVPIDVAQWLADRRTEWDFDIEEDEPLAEDGLQIVVEELTEGAKTSFANPVFMQNLRRTIARDYSLHLERGLVIALNGTEIVGWRIELLESAAFQPLRTTYTETVRGDAVTVEIIAGMAAPPPPSSDPDDDDQGDVRFGWYVICNGRVVLAADKTDVSGWGTDKWPQWHRQYSGFMGIILFTAANAAALPLTTTKRSVEQSSNLWRAARHRMRDATRPWIDYTNQRKQALEEAKAEEAKAAPVALTQVKPQLVVRVPTLVAKPAERVGNVAYAVPLTRLRSLARGFGNINMAYREVGLRAFDYAYDDVVGEE